MDGEMKSILLDLEAAGMVAPRIRLREAEADVIVEGEVSLRHSGRFLVLGPLARGGVGEVLKGRDVDLGRDVALKVLHEQFTSDPQIVQRFVEEAQIGGQLQHPGVVPVYEMGLGADGRPFFAMKLVKGRTLSALIRDRTGPPGADRGLIEAFAQACQTMAYAHSRGVIHRDLKPANVMVGAFGEVQILDWGFAKVLPRGGVADERRSAAPAHPATIVTTVRTTGVGSESIAGSVMGTPAYMPPEQALGQVEALDERSDVFSLGAILTEALTGEPPYTGAPDFVLVQAAQCSLEGAFARLNTCGADAPLVALAKRCLSPLPKDRPRDAGAVAADVETYLLAVAERAHRAALAATEVRAQAEKKEGEARDQRRLRRLSLLLAAAVLAAILGGGSMFLWVSGAQREREDRARLAVADAMTEAQRLRGEKRFIDAATAARQAVELAAVPELSAADRAAAERLAGEVEAERRAAGEAAAEAAADHALLDALEELRAGRGVILDDARTEEGLRAVFLRYGVDAGGAPAEETAAKMARRPPEVRDAVASALDEWIDVRRSRSGGGDPAPLVRLVLALDADPFRTLVRNAAGTGDAARLLEIASGTTAGTAPSRTVEVLALALLRCGRPGTALPLVRDALLFDSGDRGLLLRAAQCASALRRPREALRYAAASLSRRPRSPAAWMRYAAALGEAGHGGEAVEAWRRAVEAAPASPTARRGLGLALLAEGDPDLAIETLREAARLWPDSVESRAALGEALSSRGMYREALAAFHEARDAERAGRAERALALEESLPAILAGGARARTPEERRPLASVLLAKRFVVAAARLYAEDFAAGAEPGPEEAMAAIHAAIMAAGGDGDATALPEADRAVWREQAREWLWDALERTLSAAPPAGFVAEVSRWFRDPVLLRVRDPDRLAPLPAAEQAAWREFWRRAEIDLEAACRRPEPK
ncbi:MAG: protein kinase [Planctomycetes bacterium]|jgi:serine/threonine-protein kinase|nr:protein kinase [Planctomycetota bacterium]